MRNGHIAWMPAIKDRLGNFFFFVLAVGIFSVFFIYPFFETFRLSMQQWNGIRLARHWVWFENFRLLAQDRVRW